MTDREIDNFVAEHVMGMKPNTRYLNLCGDGWWLEPDGSYTCEIPKYSTSIADAWMVVEEMGGMWVCPADNGHGWAAGKLSLVEPSPTAGTYADSAPRAICLAAIEAVRGRK